MLGKIISMPLFTIGQLNITKKYHFFNFTRMLNMIAHHPKNKTNQTLTLVNQLTNQSNQTINSAIMLNMTICPPQEMPQCLT